MTRVFVPSDSECRAILEAAIEDFPMVMPTWGAFKYDPELRKCVRYTRIDWGHPIEYVWSDIFQRASQAGMYDALLARLLVMVPNGYLARVVR